jgi:hypothetical protein
MDQMAMSASETRLEGPTISGVRVLSAPPIVPE